MIKKFNIQAGTQFTVCNPIDYRYGKTFVCVGFDADKFGGVYCVCEDVSDRSSIKSAWIFQAEDFA